MYSHLHTCTMSLTHICTLTHVHNHTRTHTHIYTHTQSHSNTYSHLNTCTFKLKRLTRVHIHCIHSNFKHLFQTFFSFIGRFWGLNINLNTSLFSYSQHDVTIPISQWHQSETHSSFFITDITNQHPTDYNALM